MAAKYTVAQWDEVLPALQGLALRTVAIAHAVLVDGHRPSDVARKFDEPRQRVYQAVKRVEKALGEHDAVGLEPLLLWLPSAVLERLRTVEKEQISAVLVAFSEKIEGQQEVTKRTV